MKSTWTSRNEESHLSYCSSLRIIPVIDRHFPPMDAAPTPPLNSQRLAPFLRTSHFAPARTGDAVGPSRRSTTCPSKHHRFPGYISRRPDPVAECWECEQLVVNLNSRAHLVMKSPTTIRMALYWYGPISFILETHETNETNEPLTSSGDCKTAMCCYLGESSDIHKRTRTRSSTKSHRRTWNLASNTGYSEKQPHAGSKEA